MNKKLFGIWVAAVVFAVNAEAATKQIFGGTMCESVYNATSIYGEKMVYQYGSLWNRSDSNWGYVECAVPRANGYSTGTVADLEVSVTDTYGGMWCSAQVRNRYGDVIGSETVTSTGTGKRILDFGSVPGGAPYEGYLSVFCVVPKNSGAIHSISVDFNE